MRNDGLDITEGALFGTCQVAVAHQRNGFALDADDTVHHVAASVDPCQHHVADSRLFGLLQDHTLFAADDKRQHALSINRQRHAHALTHQPHRLLYDQFVIRRSRRKSVRSVRSV